MSTAAPINPPSPARLDRKRLTAFLKNVRSKATDEREGLPQREPGQLVEATEPQQQIWLHAEIAGAQLYNEPVTIHFDGELDPEAFEQAFNCVLDRHEAWRTSFEWHDGKLMQIVAPELRVRIPVEDLTSLPPKRREAAALKAAYEDAKDPIPLDRLPLFRGRLFRMAPEQYRFCLTLHHIIFDGVSLYRIFLPELGAYYAALQNRTVLNLPSLSRQYGDYALYLQQRPESEHSRLIEYWADILKDPAPPLALPLDYPRPAVRSFAGEMEKFELSRELSAELKQTGERESATLFGVLLAAYHILLYSYTGAHDQSVGTATSSRKHESTQQMLGLFLNTVVLRSKFAPSDTFIQLLHTVRQTIVGALVHDDISFGELVTRFEPNRLSGVNPLFQVMFSLEPPLAPLGSQWRFTQMDVETRLSKYDLHLEMDERQEGLIGRFIYSVELFRKETMENWKARWLVLLELIPQHPEWTVEEFASAIKQKKAAHATPSSGFWRRARNLMTGRKEN